MKYLLSQLVWNDKELFPRWEAPDMLNDKIVDLRSVADCALKGTTQGHILIATERDPLPGEIILAGSFNETLSDKATDAVKDVLALPEKVAATNLPELAHQLMSIYPGAAPICPPLMPDRRGMLRFNLGEISYAQKCPTSGVVFDNVLAELQKQYRDVQAEGGDTHRKLLSVWSRKLGIRDYETFIPQDLPKETPVKPTTTLLDSFDVGNHTDINGQASSDGWTWNKYFSNGALAVIRTDSGTYAEGQAQGHTAAYRAESNLSSTDHYVQCELRTENDSLVVMIGARKDSSATFTWYELILGSGSDVLIIQKVVAGSGTIIASNALTINTATTYTVKLNIFGSTLQTFNSGVQVGTDTTDSGISSGLRTGMRVQGNNGGLLLSGRFENFEASDGLLSVGGGAVYHHRKQLGA